MMRMSRALPGTSSLASATGCQQRRSKVPIGVPGPVRTRPSQGPVLLPSRRSDGLVSAVGSPITAVLLSGLSRVASQPRHRGVDEAGIDALGEIDGLLLAAAGEVVLLVVAHALAVQLAVGVDQRHYHRLVQGALLHRRFLDQELDQLVAFGPTAEEG